MYSFSFMAEWTGGGMSPFNQPFLLDRIMVDKIDNRISVDLLCFLCNHHQPRRVQRQRFAAKTAVTFDDGEARVAQ